MAESEDGPELNTRVSQFNERPRVALLHRLIENYIHHTGDGQDCVDKVVGYSIVGSIFGAVYGSLAVAMVPELIKDPLITPGIAACKRVATNIVTVGSVGCIYAGTSCAVASIREKDDPYNHLIGGLASGLAFGARFRSTGYALISGSFIGATLAMVRYSNLHHGVKTTFPYAGPIPDGRFGWRSPTPDDYRSIPCVERYKKDAPGWHDNPDERDSSL